MDPGLDLGKTWDQSVRLLAATATFAALGYPLLLAASNKIFLAGCWAWTPTNAATPRWPPAPWG